MRSSADTALGIDIAGPQIDMVLLARTRDRVTVLRTARVLLPDEMASDGWATDPAGLARVIRAAQRHHRIRAANVAVSLPGSAMLTRVIPLEEDDPQRIVRLVSDEIRQYASLSGRETASDFRVLIPARRGVPGRVLIAASDRKMVAGAAQACDMARLRADILEPPIVACLRTLRSMTDTLTAAGNVLLVLLKDGVMTACPFQRGTLDLVRTKAVAERNTELDTVYELAANEINAVIRFYQMERSDAPGSWAVIFADDDNASIPGPVRQRLAENLTGATLHIVTQTERPGDMGVDMPKEGAVSLTALGLALGALGPQGRGLCTNLLPPKNPGAGRWQKHIVAAAAAAGVLVLLMLIVVNAFGFMAGRVSRRVLEIKQREWGKQGRTLAVTAEELASVEQQATLLSQELDYLGRIADAGGEVNWVRLLTDMQAAVPQPVYVTRLFTRDGPEMVLQGMSHSYEDVHLFAQGLSKSAHISRASIVETSREKETDGLIRYTIKCAIGP
jgi:Tfp pilus assembly PilM family ATPase/Tfp pilus assembly protein PilN